ncbi:hypothetical protein [Rhodococcus rhodnii]|uniref:Uncharacterized protein n=1 Tax=Rhodococcus rhodnii LMG 5362 TaxID=1273125 RepID=R7WRG2_9NOCA|nr:hypothetical protein [Rhodococcus rhodnii]EOM77917.1 hypothetical protein Rrhod_0726 [Rhodococcus rhodnii LMG 5362]
MPSLEDLIVQALADLRAAREAGNETRVATAEAILDSRLARVGR